MAIGLSFICEQGVLDQDVYSRVYVSSMMSNTIAVSAFVGLLPTPSALPSIYVYPVP